MYRTALINMFLDVSGHFHRVLVSKVILTILILLFSLFSYSQVVDGDTFHYNRFKTRLNNNDNLIQ